MIISYGSVVRRHWMLLIGGVAIGLLAAALSNAVLPKSYISQARLFVAPSDSNGSADAVYQGSLSAVLKAKSYVELARSERIDDEISERLGPNFVLDADSFQDKIEVTAVPDTAVIVIAASDSNPERAQAVAAAATNAVVSLVIELEQPRASVQPPLAEVRVAQMAGRPKQPAFPRPILNLVLGGVIGLLVGAGAALGVEVRRVRRKVESDRQVGDADGASASSLSNSGVNGPGSLGVSGVVAPNVGDNGHANLSAGYVGHPMEARDDPQFDSGAHPEGDLDERQIKDPAQLVLDEPGSVEPDDGQAEADLPTERAGDRVDSGGVASGGR